MNQHAEYVSPGHPDRLADAIAESIVTAAVRQRPDALVGVEVAVHTDCVFVDGRIAAGPRSIDIEEIVRNVYRAAGYGGSWKPEPGKIRVATEQILKELEAGGLEGAGSTFTSEKLILNGAGEFAIGGPEGDKGLSGKKLVIDHYGPGVPIGGGALAGKDPHKVDKCGALRARQLAKKAHVTLGWAPGGDTPFLVEASTSQGSVNLQVPSGELPPEDWFTLKSIVRDLELQERDWVVDLLAGYFCQSLAPWER